MKIKVNSIVRLYSILLLSEKPRCGYELMEELRTRLERKISPSQVYPFLAILQEERLIKVAKRGTRESKIYQLTGEGEKFISGLMQHFGDLALLAIKPKLTICTHCGCKVVEGGHKEKIKGKKLVFCCHHCAAAFKELKVA